MKLTVFLLFFGLINLIAGPTYSQNTKISLNMKDASVKSVLSKIEEISEFYFLYNSKLINVERKVDIVTEKEPIKNILSEILSNDVSVIVSDRQIVLSPAQGSDELKELLQQQRTITGRVTRAADGTPLPGVTVLLSGTTVGNLTDVDGRYSLEVPTNQAVLHFSFIGYSAQDITVGNQTVINVSLVESLMQMDEVVVTALGIKRESKSLGYAATSISTEQIVNAATVNVGNALLGKVAGLNVMAPPTGAGGSSKIRIRGQSSFGGNNTPLIVLNGVPIDNTSTFSGGDFGDGMQSINPEDIESMTVLKGASAAALYGYRAKDGVIIITTKTGAGRKGLGIDFTSTFTADEPLDYTEFQDQYGQGEYGVRPQNVAGARATGSFSFGEKFDGAQTWQIDGEQHPYVFFPDRIKSIFRTGTTIANTVAFSGGNENGNFHFSVSNSDSRNIVPNSSYSKKIMDLGLNYKFGERLTLQANANYSIEKHVNVFQGTQGGLFSSLLRMTNSIDPRWFKDTYKDANGNEVQYTSFSAATNWYWLINERKQGRDRNRIFGNVLLKYDITPWLYIQGRVGQDWYGTYQFNLVPNGQASSAAVVSGFTGSFSQGKNNYNETNMDFMIVANKTFGSFGVNATFGGNKMIQKLDGITNTANNFFIKRLYTIGNGQIKTPTYDYSEKEVNSLYGMLDLSFKDYLFLNLTGRNDWFSTLNPESNSYLYPSVSTSFLFSQAFSSIMPSWLTYGKLRASYAEVGGDTDPYTNALFYSLNSQTFNNLAYGGISGNISPNPNLRPLKVKEIEAGLELILFQRRISLDVAVYRKNTVDEILNVDISSASGFTQTKVNVGKLRNQGIETLLTVVPVRTQNFTWESGINYTYNQSEVLQLASGQTKIDVGSSGWIGTVSQEVGMPMCSLRGLTYRYDDQGRIITVGGKFQAGELITFGSAIPKNVGAWLNTFTYRGIRVFTQIDTKFGKDFKIISNNSYNAIRAGHGKETLPGREGGVVFDGVNLDGTPNDTPVVAETFYADYASKKVIDPMVHDADFVKWRTLTIGYDFTRLLRNTFIKGLTANASINNVLLIKKYIPHLDPECVQSVSDTNAGIESTSAPTTRTYAVSLNFSF